MVFLNGTLKSGIETVLDLLDFDRRLEGVDVVVTGEELQTGSPYLEKSCRALVYTARRMVYRQWQLLEVWAKGQKIF